MAVSAKTLRKLGKQVGIQPSKLFRMKPEEVSSVLEAEYGLKDLGSWGDADAESWIASQKEQEAPKEEAPVEQQEKEVVEEKPKPAPKKTSKRAPRKTSKKAEVAEKVEAKEEQEDKPRRRRKKKSTVPGAAPTFSKGSIEGSVEELKERVIGLEGEISELKATLKDLTAFMTWWHNLQLDPKDPITSLSAVDWEGCIDDQMKS